MKAMILCAGFGTRLGDATKETPKPLLEAGPARLIDFILANLYRYGFDEVIVNVHFQAAKLRAGLQKWTDNGAAISFSHEKELLGTAGAVKYAEKFFSPQEDFLVQYGDVVTDVDLQAMLQFHRHTKAVGTVLVHSRSRSNSSLAFETDFRVSRFLERPPESYWHNVEKTWVNSGIMIFSPSVLDLVPSGTPADWPRDVFPKLIACGGLYAFPLQGYRIAVDSQARLKQLEQDIRAGALQQLSFELSR
jgi:NDP-sugar pyrophosphorylase family protein